MTGEHNYCNHNGRVIWITGLSGSGKTTLAKILAEKIPGSILLDGDEMREVFGSQSSNFDSEGRFKLAMTYARLARMLARQGFTVLVATISMFNEARDWNKKNQPGYLEVFLDVPEDVRVGRDPKGLYAATRSGRMTDMAGYSMHVELPLNPHLRLTGIASPEEEANLVLDAIYGDR